MQMKESDKSLIAFPKMLHQMHNLFVLNFHASMNRYRYEGPAIFPIFVAETIR